MKTQQLSWSQSGGWSSSVSLFPRTPPDLVLVFGGREQLEHSTALGSLSELFPRDRFFGCSTAGEILDTRVTDDSVVATAIWLERSKIDTACVRLSELQPGENLGERLARSIPREGIKHAFVLSDGRQVNGSEMVAGLTRTLPPNVGVSGGLSGDGSAMQTTVVCHRGKVETSAALIIAFSGDITIGCGSLGGWDPFGPQRIVTRAEGNVLYELDGEPALTLYKRYLAHHAQQLPSSALLFPLMVQLPGEQAIVRTILGVDEATGTMTFAGNVPSGASAQLMRANFDRIIGGAFAAARNSQTASPPELGVMISCIGRKLILKQRIEEETEAVREVFGPAPALTGFYSYGELAPFTRGARCQLHNQTMTVTTFSER